MSCLDATFTLTPRSPVYVDLANNNEADLWCFGTDAGPPSPWDFTSLYTSNRFCFEDDFAADPNVDYSSYANRKKTRFLEAWMDLWGPVGSNKSLVLIFGFDVFYTTNPGGRVLVYSDASLLKDQQLVYGDNQFIIEIESWDTTFMLHFIHAGGDWFFRGLSGYVV